LKKIKVDYKKIFSNVYLFDSIVWIKYLNQQLSLKLKSFKNSDLYRHFFNEDFSKHNAYEDTKATYCWMFQSKLDISTIEQNIIEFKIFYNNYCINEKTLYNKKKNNKSFRK